jgi:hypothetical protein
MKKIILPALICCGLFVAVVSCTDESIDATGVVVKSKSVSASRLSALHDKVKPSKADKNEYVETLRSLSFEESLEYRDIQHGKIIAEYRNTPQVIRALEEDRQWFKAINVKSMELFGKPILQVSDSQMDVVFSNYDNMINKQSKVAAKDCPIVDFNMVFPKATNIGKAITQYDMNGVTETQQSEKKDKDSSKGDCDCELQFVVPNEKFTHLVPIEPAIPVGISDPFVLLSLFNNQVGGTLKFNKGKYILYLDGGVKEKSRAKEYHARPVFGKKRVRLVNIDVFNLGCDVLNKAYKITDNVVVTGTGTDGG